MTFAVDWALQTNYLYLSDQFADDMAAHTVENCNGWFFGFCANQIQYKCEIMLLMVMKMMILMMVMITIKMTMMMMMTVMV